MKGIFWIRDEKNEAPLNRRETDLAEAVQRGAKACGDTIEIREVTSTEPEVVDCDLILKIGCKSRYWFWKYQDAGIPYAYFDKGFIRTRAPIKWLEYWRVSVNGHQPVNYIEQAKHDSKRADEMQLGFSPWYSRNTEQTKILLDGSSEKHMLFNKMGNPNDVASELVQRIRKVSQRPIVYRPKPSFRGAVPIEGTEWARGRSGIHDKDFSYDLRRSRVVVTYGSNICFDAALFGVPSVVLAHGIAGPISSHEIEDIEHPKLASDPERRQWLNNVAHCQFKLNEFASGEGWKVIRDMMACTPL